MNRKIFSDQLNDLIGQLKKCKDEDTVSYPQNLVRSLTEKFSFILSLDEAFKYVVGAQFYMFIYKLLDSNLRQYYQNPNNSMGQDRLLKKQSLLNQAKIYQNSLIKTNQFIQYKIFPEVSSNNSIKLDNITTKQKFLKLQEYLERLNSFSDKKVEILTLCKIYPQMDSYCQNYSSWITVEDLWKQSKLIYQNCEDGEVPNQIIASEDFLKIHNFLSLIEKLVFQIKTTCLKILSKNESQLGEDREDDSIKGKKSEKKSLLTEIIKEASQNSFKERKSIKTIQKAFNEYKIQYLPKKRQTQPLLQQMLINQYYLQTLKPKKKKKQMKVSLQNCSNCSQCTIF